MVPARLGFIYPLPAIGFKTSPIDSIVPQTQSPLLLSRRFLAVDGVTQWLGRQSLAGGLRLSLLCA